MSNQKVFVPLTGPTSVQDLSSSQQSNIITYVDAVVHTGTDNISFQLEDGVVNIVIVPKAPISADYIANTYINYAATKPAFDQNIISLAPNLITQVGMAVIITPPIIAELIFKTQVPNVSPATLTKTLDLTKTTFGDLKNMITTWSNIKPEDQIIGTTDLGPISEEETITDSTLLVDCKVYDSDSSSWKYYFTATGAQVAVLDSNPIPPQPTKVPKEYKVCLYYASWGIYARNYYPPAIDYSRVTHLIYAFADIAPDTEHPEPNGKVLEDGTVYMPDINDIRANFQSLANIKKKYPHLKTILSIGGWTYSVNFSDTAADPDKRQRFVDSAYSLMTNYGFDGIDIDWEIPVEGGNNIKHRPEDKQNYTALLQALRDKIGDDKLLTIAGPARPKYNENIEVEKIGEIVDWINVMAYDYHGPWMGTENAVTNFNAPLYADYSAPIPKGVTHDLNIDATVRSLLTLGLPAEKIVLGLSFYGRGFSGVTPGPNKDGLYQTYTGHPKGTWPDEKGQASAVFDYWDLHDNYIGQPGWQDYYNHQAGAAWLFNEEEGIFIGYDSPQTIWNKCAYLASLNLGGAMMWEASNDRYNQLLYVVSNALNEGGIEATGDLVPSSAGSTPSWKDDTLSNNGTIPLSKIMIAETTNGIVGIKTTYDSASSAWRGSSDGIRSEVTIPSNRFIDRIDFYLGSGTQETFIGIGFNIDNRTYIALGDTNDVSNMVSIGTESSRLIQLQGTVQNGKLVQLTGNFNQGQKSNIKTFESLQDLTDDQLEGTPLQFEMAGGYAYVGHFQGSVTSGGIDLTMQTLDVDTPHLSITAGSFDIANQVSLDGGFSYKMGMQFKSVEGSFKIGDPNNPAMQVDYEGPDFGFYNEVQYTKGSLSVQLDDTLINADFEAGNKGFTCDVELANGFSETLEIDSSHIKIGLDRNGIEINSQRIGIFFGYGPFTIHITLINFAAIVAAVQDFINIGKAIWDASFKIYLAYKKFVTGVVKAVEDVMKFLFG